MKKFFIYQDGKLDYYVANSKRNKTLGKLVGHIYGTETEKDISVGFEKGDVVCLIKEKRIEVSSSKFY